MPAVSRITDLHTCPAHGGGPVITGEDSVIIGNQPVARIGDKMTCGPTIDVIIEGENSVTAGYMPVARVGDGTAHKGKLSTGDPTVIIGSSPQNQTLKTDKPFCEECERARKEEEARAQRGKA